jgi:hypothetical protein
MKLDRLAVDRSQRALAAQDVSSDGQDQYDSKQKKDRHHAPRPTVKGIGGGRERRPAPSDYCSGAIGVRAAIMAWVAASSGSETRPY